MWLGIIIGVIAIVIVSVVIIISINSGAGEMKKNLPFQIQTQIR